MSNNHIRTQNKMSKALQLIAEHYKEPTQKLIIHLQKKHKYSLRDLEPIMGISRTAIRDNWLRPMEEKK